MVRLRFSRARMPSGRPLFTAPPPTLSAVGSALLEPVVALLVFAALWQSADLAPSRADQALMLLWLALTFPAPDLLGRPLLQRLSEAAVSWVMVVLVLLVCGWATRSLDLVDLSRWAWWALLTPLIHQVAQGAIGAVVQQARLQGPHSRALVWGVGPTAQRLAAALPMVQDARGRPYQVVGVIGVDPQDAPAVSQAQTDLCGESSPEALKRSTLARLIELLRHARVDEVFVALEGDWSRWSSELWEALQDSTVAVHVVPDLSGALLLQGRVRTIEGLPVVSLLEAPFGGINWWIKRAEDLVIASVALLLLWPLMLLIAAGVRVDSSGPALFRQRRWGLDGQVIEVWKFRTMRTQAGDDVRQATPDDPRTTRFGRFLRRTSLDELPQFLNVLQGRMSVVGPRPHALAHNEHYRGLVRAYMLRHKVKPGITGWAQIHGLRGQTDTVDKMRCRVEYDLEYLRNWSLALDLQIVLRTVGLIFKDDYAW